MAKLVATFSSGKWKVSFTGCQPCS